MSHENGRDDCDCGYCLLRRMIEEMTSQGPPLHYIDPRSLPGRWIKYQQTIANLRAHAMRIGSKRAQDIVQVAGLDKKYEGSILGPLTGYQVIVRDAKHSEAMTKAKDEMSIIASLITPLLPGILESCRSLVPRATEEEVRWQFYDHIAMFDALVMLRTVMLDMANVDQLQAISDIDVLEEVGVLVEKVEHRTLRDS
jgi:hypothetical protein